MPKRMIVSGVIFLALAILPAARCAADVNPDDAVVDHFFSAVRDGNFSAATQHFNVMMKQMSPAALKGSWDQLYAQEGPLLGWNIFERRKYAKGNHEISVHLRFHRATADSIIVVVPSIGEIASVLFKLPASLPPYADRTKFHTDEVTIGAYKLSGHLRIPIGNGLFPAIVLIQGSGAIDRDETVGANHPFADIADGLASRRIIALRYDKRTFAYRTLDPPVTTVDAEVIEDGVAAVRLLQARREVAQDRIFIIGHSLGAMLAPEIAKKAWPVGGIVMLAPSGRKLPQLIVEQTRLLGEASPRQLVEIERQADELSAHKMPPAENFFGTPASYYYDLDARDEVAIARGLDLPILILHGSRDFPAVEEDIRDWQAGLKGDAKVQVETLKDLNHLLIAGAGKPTPAEYSAPGHVDAAVIGTIASFIANGGATTSAGGAPAHQAASN